MTRNFRHLLEAQWDKGNFVCVGLDPDLEKIPASAHRETVEQTLVDFNVEIITKQSKDLKIAPLVHINLV
jgi:hypothetical protein